MSYRRDKCPNKGTCTVEAEIRLLDELEPKQRQDLEPRRKDVSMKLVSVVTGSGIREVAGTLDPDLMERLEGYKYVGFECMGDRFVRIARKYYTLRDWGAVWCGEPEDPSEEVDEVMRSDGYDPEDSEEAMALFVREGAGKLVVADTAGALVDWALGRTCPSMEMTYEKVEANRIREIRGRRLGLKG